MSKPVDAAIPNRLRFYRKFHGLTLGEAGRLVGCSHTQVADLEKGKVQLTLHWMRVFASAYHVAPADLLVEEDRGIDMNEGEIALIRQLRQVSQDKKAATLRLLDAVLAA
jgi:transcriptional regulator with XRE-family HTH domain